MGLAHVERSAAVLQANLKALIERLLKEYESCRVKVADLTASISELKASAAQAEGHKFDDAARLMASLLGADFTDVATLLTNVRTTLIDLGNRSERVARLQIEFRNSMRQLEDMQVLEKKSASLTAEVESQKSDLDASAERRARVADQLQLAQKESLYHAMLAQIREQGERLGLRDGRCPLCGSKLSPAAYAAHLGEIRQEIDTHSSVLSDLTRQEAEIASEYKLIQEPFEAKRAEVSRLLSDLEALKRHSASIQAEASSLGLPLKTEDIATTCLKNTSA